MTFPSITMILLLLPVSIYYYKKGSKLYLDKLKMPVPNSDGLINCLQPAQDSFSIHPKHLWEKNISHLLASLHPDSFFARDSTVGLAADALAPCFLLVILTISSWPKTHIRHPDLVPLLSFIVTRNLLPFNGTGKKQVTATQTAPNQTAGPLGGIARKPRYGLR